MDFSDLISPNDYVAQNFPLGLPDAVEGNGDALGKLKELLFGQQGQPPMPPSQGMPSMAPQPIPNAAPLSQATDFSARRRDVPLPVSRPDAAGPGAPMSLAPDNPGADNSLASIIGGGNPMQSALASFGGGLATAQGRGKLSGFSRGFGGAVKSGIADDREQVNQRIKALKSLQEAKQFGTNEEYKKALTNYYSVLTSQKQTETANLTSKAANPAATAVTAAAKPAAAAGSEISMQGDGTQGTPYQPASKDDYDGIESGSYYTVNGQLRRKK